MEVSESRLWLTSTTHSSISNSLSLHNWLLSLTIHFVHSYFIVDSTHSTHLIHPQFSIDSARSTHFILLISYAVHHWLYTDHTFHWTHFIIGSPSTQPTSLISFYSFHLQYIIDSTELYSFHSTNFILSSSLTLLTLLISFSLTSSLTGLTLPISFILSSPLTLLSLVN